MAGHPPRSTDATGSQANSASSAAQLRPPSHAYSAPSAGALITSSGRVVVYATTAVYRREDDPYKFILVDLEEGFRMMSCVEAVLQLRRECGDRQVENPNIALVHGNGGVLSSQVSALLGSERAL